MKIECPHCAQRIEVTEEWFGQAVDCPSCRQPLTVPPRAVAIPMPKTVPKHMARAQSPQLRRPAHGGYRPPRSGGGFGKSLLVLLMLAGAGFGSAMVHFNESPQRIWNHLVNVVKPAPGSTPTPAPTPVGTPKPTVVATAIPIPAQVAPEMIRESTPTPTQVDPIAWLCDHRQRAPKQLLLKAPVTFAIIANGRESGQMEVPSGAVAEIVGFTPKAAELRFLNATAAHVPVDATNLRTLAQAEMARPAPSGVLSTAVQPADAISRTAVLPRRFIHPGAPLNLEDLETLKANLDKEPWKSGYAALAADSHSQLGVRVSGPFAEVGRAPNVNLWPWRSDMTSIWCLARMWYFTGKQAYAQRAHDILIAWATTQTVFSGREATLDIGDYAYKFVGGAEILRGTWPGWTEADTAAVKNYFSKILLPATNKFGENMYGAGNKGALSMVAAGLMEIFNDDPVRLDATLWQYRALPHIGIRNSNAIGELGDSLRDQGHFHGQFLSLAMLAEALWKQGIDLYAEQDNRLLAVGEYFARVNLQLSTPFLPFGTTDAYYIADDTNHGWEHGRMALNLIHGAYVVRKGLQAPYVEMRRQQLPIDGESFMFEKVADPSSALPLPALSFPGTVSVTRGMHDVDLGGAAPAGGSSYSGVNWKVTGAGDARHADESCHFTYKTVTGDCAIIARVESIGDSGKNAKAGVMLRASLDPAAPRGLMVVNKGGQVEQNFQGFSIYGGSNYGTKALRINQTSYWVKLERTGKILAGYISPDGTNWAATDVGQFNQMPETVYIGMMVCSGIDGTLNSTIFTNVQITGGDGEAPVVIPAPPAALLASPGEKSVSLRWQPSFGANCYLIKRSTTSGGPYQAIAKVTGTSYVDTSVTGGGAYYYVVTALNIAGESANSSEACDRPSALRYRIGSYNTGGYSGYSSLAPGASTPTSK